MRKYSDHGGKISLKILMDLHVLSNPEYEEVVLVMLSVCVCMYVCMYGHVSY
jgi:hypothetical protein